MNFRHDLQITSLVGNTSQSLSAIICECMYLFPGPLGTQLDRRAKAPPAELGGNLHNVVLVEKRTGTFVYYYCARGININVPTDTSPPKKYPSTSAFPASFRTR